jgi:hypothetical protein
MSEFRQKVRITAAAVTFHFLRLNSSDDLWMEQKGEVILISSVGIQGLNAYFPFFSTVFTRNICLCMHTPLDLVYLALHDSLPIIAWGSKFSLPSTAFEISESARIILQFFTGCNLSPR